MRFARRPIAEVAAAKLREAPQFAALRLPSWKRRGMAMVAAAHAMADAAATSREIFTAAGLPAGFIDQLRRAAESLSASFDERRDGQTARMGATRGLRETERRGRLALRVVDSLVVPALGHDDALLTAWRGARRIQRKPGPAQEMGQGPGGPAPALTTGNAVLLLSGGPTAAPPAPGRDDGEGEKHAA